jgi:hypothetical protein
MGLLHTSRNRGQVLSAQYDKEYARIFIDRNPVKSHLACSLQTLHRMPSESWGHRPVLPTIFFFAGMISVKALPKIQFAIFSDRFAIFGDSLFVIIGDPFAIFGDRFAIFGDRFAIFGDLNEQKRELKKTTFPRFAIFSDPICNFR